MRALSRRLSGLRDLALRADYLRHLVLEMPPATVAEMVMLTVNGAEARDKDYAQLLQCLSLALSDPACQNLRTDVGRLLRACDLTSLADLVCEDTASQSQAEETLPVSGFGVDRPLTLGERKSLARRRDRDLLARVLRDPHPDVIGILLGNPALTEADVLRLCARRPIPSEVLRQVFRNPRWVARYAIKVALSLNPYTPLNIRLQLAPLLSRQDILRLLQTSDLPNPLSESCQRIAGRSTVH